ncbi:MAG: UDP-N-acetylglucosamine 2-epimerase [Candidatus Omnitrophota bacterium]|nr:UDP-N-acetylglucosamine 2-epimerase [Candidatus Omnitrophota bacterium]
MRTIGVVTVGRSDYGIYTPLLRRLQAEPSLKPQLIVAAAHLSQQFGMTVERIERDGFPIGDRVEMPLAGDTSTAVARAMGAGVAGFAAAYERLRPNLLIVLGDRYEMHAAAAAAVPFNIPLVHLHGGELTEGAMDDALRHSITKLSHLHFVSTEEAARRVAQMGEEPWRVVVSGALSLDRVASMRRWSVEELIRSMGLQPWTAPPLLVTFHPVTRELDQTAWQVAELLDALRQADRPTIFTQPNADPNGRVVEELIQAFVARTPTAQYVKNFGPEAYFNMMAQAAAMVGNSSSGLIEAPSFELPVVNVGTRQGGRLRADNVIDVGYGREEVAEGLRRALATAFRERLRGLRNPYGDGRASEIIVSRLRQVPLDDRLLRKRFNDGARAVREETVVADVR